MTVTVDASKTMTGDPSYIGSGTFAQMKAVAGMGNGAIYLVTNYGRGGSLWRYSSADSDWFPVSPLKVYENTALLSGMAQVATQVIVAIPIEAGLLAKKLWRAIITTAKNGGTDTITGQLRMGALGTTADALLANHSTLAGTNRSVGDEVWFRLASTTSVERLGGSSVAAWGNSPTSGVASGPTTVDTVASANFISLGCTSSGTTDTPQVGYVAIEIQP